VTTHWTMSTGYPSTDLAPLRRGPFLCLEEPVDNTYSIVISSEGLGHLSLPTRQKLPLALSHKRSDLLAPCVVRLTGALMFSGTTWVLVLWMAAQNPTMTQFPGYRSLQDCQEAGKKAADNVLAVNPNTGKADKPLGEMPIFTCVPSPR
jgi:hypothetical protein